MIKWLKSAAEACPPRIDAPPEASIKGGYVEPDFKAGSVILLRGDRHVTLKWSKDDRDRRRALEPGDYKVRTTRLESEQDGEHWFLSSTGPAKKSLRVAKRGPTKLSIDGEVHFNARADRKRKYLNLGFGLMTADHRGLSVYRAGKRVPVTYKVLDRKGRVLQRGSMNYG